MMRPGTALSRAGALAILAALLGLFWIGPVASYLGLLRAGHDSVTAAETTLARDRRLVDQGAGAMPQLQSVLFPAMSDAEAASLFQEALKSAAAAARVEIGGLQVLPSAPLGGARRIGVRVRARGDMAGIERLLYAIEAARPVFHPDNLDIESREGSGQTSSALDFELEVSGFTAGGS
ncbi:MAG: type II secretion system protein GspM [Stellaceae bacterium]